MRSARHGGNVHLGLKAPDAPGEGPGAPYREGIALDPTIIADCGVAVTDGGRRDDASGRPWTGGVATIRGESFTRYGGHATTRWTSGDSAPADCGEATGTLS
jgi:hypothetical protein